MRLNHFDNRNVDFKDREVGDRAKLGGWAGGGQ